ncbi:unnamed protein product, partial [Ectocarpus sp. 12 AP-2014]
PWYGRSPRQEETPDSRHPTMMAVRPRRRRRSSAPILTPLSLVSERGERGNTTLRRRLLAPVRLAPVRLAPVRLAPVRPAALSRGTAAREAVGGSRSSIR